MSNMYTHSADVDVKKIGNNFTIVIAIVIAY